MERAIFPMPGDFPVPSKSVFQTIKPFRWRIALTAEAIGEAIERTAPDKSGPS